MDNVDRKQFKDLKQQLLTPQFVCLLDLKRDFILETDASRVVFGAVLT